MNEIVKEVSDYNQRFKLVQNEALGAILIHVCANAYFDESMKLRHLPLELALLTLPLVFNERFCLTFYKMRSSSALFRLMIDNPQLRVGIQKRVESLAKLTFRALDIGNSTGLFNYDSTTQTFQALKLKIPDDIKNSNSEMFYCADKLGRGFLSLGFNQVSTLLGVRY